MTVNASGLGFREINGAIRAAGEDVTVTGCLGQRFICAGMSDVSVKIEGVPGNALGAYLNGARIAVEGNAQDAVGDTMNGGRITVAGSIGDAAGYAMRGGEIFVRGDAGYRAGIHMKAYGEKYPVMIIGGCAGSFLGEYQAGGLIAVLGLGRGDRPIVGDFPCTGMHGGRVILRSGCEDVGFPANVVARPAGPGDLEEIGGYLKEFCAVFGYDPDELLDSPFTLVSPASSNPYKQLYAPN
ncbi:MAG: glutamate synthase [Clostridia bacterium]|nr:glutamate synthase [Clostridia bacterium]